MELNKYLEDRYAQIIVLQEILHKITMEVKVVIDKRGKYCENLATVTVAKIPIETTEELPTETVVELKTDYTLQGSFARNKAIKVTTYSKVHQNPTLQLELQDKLFKESQEDTVYRELTGKYRNVSWKFKLRYGHLHMTRVYSVKKKKLKREVFSNLFKGKNTKDMVENGPDEYDPHVKLKKNTTKDGLTANIICKMKTQKMMTPIEPG